MLNITKNIHNNTLSTERYKKLQNLRIKDKIVYPNDFIHKHDIAILHKKYGYKDKPTLESLNFFVIVAGRIMLKRNMGKVSFISLQDNGDQIQLFISLLNVGRITYDAFKKWDLGDIIKAEGVLFRTNKNEFSVRCSSLQLLSKSLYPLPDKFHGLINNEIRYRKRYIDLIVNYESRKTFLIRSQTINLIRSFMIEEGFLEVETPMLHPIPGGASAKPFITYHNTLDAKMYLRVAPELYLKRLIIGGFNRVFELSRNFRNEGISPRHNPEFTMIEFYAAYTNYYWLINFIEKLICKLVLNLYNCNTINYNGCLVNLSKPFKRFTIVEAIQYYNPNYNIVLLSDAEFLRKELKCVYNISINEENFIYTEIEILQLALFEETTVKKLWQPTIITDYPIKVSPLARASDKNQMIAERFELFIVGQEIANGFSELNDPEEQARRFHEQSNNKFKINDKLDGEQLYYDADYIHALEYGMPPTSGCGIGIDRLIMLLTNKQTIRDVLLFPHLREHDY